ncbi:hypothetical protein RND81_14G030900 [Saponaria officinalis]|uniref:MULE transposase domain-containing protein n=1 Tax=Saponaria officinalis TaxID=3572 RepID=A0AAW1GKS6_SAPOF
MIRRSPKRNRKTVKCQCTFRIRAVENYRFEDKKQLVLWNIVTANGFECHNHHPTKYKDGHHHYAGLNEEEKAYVRQQYRASVLPRDIKSGLHQKTPDKPRPSSSQIYTETSKIRKEMRREMNIAQQMLALAINSDTHELTHVFMSHPEAVKLFHTYPHVVLIYSTYKTNTYNMALVEVVGVTPEGSSFLIACVLIPSESEEWYTWLLRKLMDILECTGTSPSVFVTDRELGLVRALRTQFPETPHLLCLFYKDHVLNNPEIGWWNVIDATCEDDFNMAWSVFSQKTWGEHAKKFVLCYTNEYFHLGNTATSRVEFAHSLLKAWLKSAHITLDTMSTLENPQRATRFNESTADHPTFVFLVARKSVYQNLGDYGGRTLKRCCVGSRVGTRVRLCLANNSRLTLCMYAMPKNDNDMMEELVDKARQSDPVYRKVFLEKLRDILHPEDEDILSPDVRENPKGRPRGSTTRNISGFEHSMRKYGTPSTDASTNIQHMVGDFAAGVAGAHLKKNYTKGLLSTWVKRYGVPEEFDGHCGFRVLSHALRGGEEDYIQMRDWCLKKISGSDVYKGLFEAGIVTKNGLSKCENTLRRIYFIHRTACGKDHWMSSDDLFVFASLFNWTICVIGENCYAKGPKDMTILPLKSSIEGVLPCGVLWIVNHKSHWMRLHSRRPPDEVPMPPIDPPWIIFR